jgi:hypothetical protein
MDREQFPEANPEKRKTYIRQFHERSGGLGAELGRACYDEDRATSRQTVSISLKTAMAMCF